MKQRDIVNFFGDIRERVQPLLSMSTHQDLLTSLLQLLYKPKHNHEDVLNVSHVLCQLVTNGAHECIIIDPSQQAALYSTLRLLQGSITSLPIFASSNLYQRYTLQHLDSAIHIMQTINKNQKFPPWRREEGATFAAVENGGVSAALPAITETSGAEAGTILSTAVNVEITTVIDICRHARYMTIDDKSLKPELMIILNDWLLLPGSEQPGIDELFRQFTQHAELEIRLFRQFTRHTELEIRCKQIITKLFNQQQLFRCVYDFKNYCLGKCIFLTTTAPAINIQQFDHQLTVVLVFGCYRFDFPEDLIDPRKSADISHDNCHNKLVLSVNIPTITEKPPSVREVYVTGKGKFATELSTRLNDYLYS